MPEPDLRNRGGVTNDADCAAAALERRRLAGDKPVEAAFMGGVIERRPEERFSNKVI